MKVNYFGLRLNKGVTVATFVTTAPRHGVAQPSTLGVLHSRSRLGSERITSMLAGAPFTVRQDHNTGITPRSPRRHIGRTGPYGHVLAHGVAV